MGTIVAFISGLSRMNDPWNDLVDFFRNLSNTGLEIPHDHCGALAQPEKPQDKDDDDDQADDVDEAVHEIYLRVD